MSSLNIRITQKFKKDLSKFMRLRHIDTKSEAIRVAIQEGLARASLVKASDFNSWLGLGLKAPINKKRIFFL